jgi:hypothetical protein
LFHQSIKMELKITTRNVYGNMTMYPANETAKLFTQLIGKKTLSLMDIHTIKKLGYQIIYDNNLEISK